MTYVPLHPALVHLPLGLSIVLPLVAAGMAFALWRGLVPRRTWGVVVGLQAALVVGALVALKTGEREERRVEPVVGETALERHEEAAEVFLWGSAVVLALTAAGLAVPERSAAAVATAAAAGTLVVAGLAFRTGKAGGELVYVRGAASAYQAAPGVAAGDLARPAAHRDEHHD